jgi:hypothetical protein
MDVVFAVGMKEGIRASLSDDVDVKRLDGLLLIRNAMLHGGAPDLFASSKYLEYARTYAADPSTDIQLLVAKCLRASIFGSNFRVQDNPDAEILKMALKQGLMPVTNRSRAIVAE